MSRSSAAAGEVRCTYTRVRERDVQPETRVCKNGHVVTPDVIARGETGNGKSFPACGICRENARQRHFARVGKRVTRPQL